MTPWIKNQLDPTVNETRKSNLKKIGSHKNFLSKGTRFPLFFSHGSYCLKPLLCASLSKTNINDHEIILEGCSINR